MDISRRKRRPSVGKIDTTPSSLITLPVGWIISISNNRGEFKTFDFGALADKRAELAKHFLNAFRGLELELCSRIQFFHSIQRFWQFLDCLEQKKIYITKLIEIDLDVLEYFVLWLNTQKTRDRKLLSPSTQRHAFNNIKQTLKWLLIYERKECSPNLSFPYNPFPQSSKNGKSREPYSKDELTRIVKAIESELEEINQKIEKPYVLQNIGRDPRIRYSSGLRDWNNMIRYFENKLFRRWRSRDWLTKNKHRCFLEAAQKYHGGIKTVWERLGVSSRIYDSQRTKKEHKLCRPTWKEWENVVWYFEKVLNCQYKSMTWLKKNGHTTFVSAAQSYHGGLTNVQKKLGIWNGTSHQLLLPFLILFAIVTGANPEPMFEMERDCIREDALLGNKYVVWQKRRGKSVHRSWSSTARIIVERVLELTKDLVPDAGAFVKYLWLVRDWDGTVRRIRNVHSQKFQAFT